MADKPITPNKHHAFNPDRWATERRARQQRFEIDVAKRQVSAGRAERITKPGVWRVFKVGAGGVVAEIFA